MAVGSTKFGRIFWGGPKGISSIGCCKSIWGTDQNCWSVLRNGNENTYKYKYYINLNLFILANLHISLIGGNCSDLLSFCARLSGYCSFMTGPLERGLALESYSELKELQSRFEQFGQGNPTKGVGSGEQQLSLPAGCESGEWGKGILLFTILLINGNKLIIHFF